MERLLRHEFGTERYNKVTKLRVLPSDCMLEANYEGEHKLFEKVEVAFIVWTYGVEEDWNKSHIFIHYIISCITIILCHFLAYFCKEVLEDC